MNPFTRPTRMACLSALLMALGCASTTQSVPTAPEADAPPVPSAAPQAEIQVRETGAAKLGPVYFDTDRSLLRPEARETLKREARAILHHPEWGVVTIAGHCDERGSEEYNLALGGRRAAAVKQYLADLGVPSSRLETRSYGEMRPAVAGHDEAAWRLNRRSELQSQALDSASRD